MASYLPISRNQSFKVPYTFIGWALKWMSVSGEIMKSIVFWGRFPITPGVISQFKVKLKREKEISLISKIFRAEQKAIFCLLLVLCPWFAEDPLNCFADLLSRAPSVTKSGPWWLQQVETWLLPGPAWLCFPGPLSVLPGVLIGKEELLNQSLYFEDWFCILEDQNCQRKLDSTWD